MLLKAKIDKLIYIRTMIISFVIFSIIVIACFILHLRYSKELIFKRYIEIFNSIGDHIISDNNYIDQLLQASLTAFEEYLIRNPQPTTEELVELKDRLGVTFLVTHDKYTGKIEFASKYYDTPDSLNIYNNYSLFDRCPDRKEWRNLDYNTTVFYPAKFCTTCTKESKNKGQKNVIAWSVKLQTFLQVSISSNDLDKILIRKIKYNSNITTISLLSPNGVIISSTKYQPGSHYNQQEFKYNNLKVINDKTIIISDSIGSIFDKQTNCDRSGFINSQDYFYVLMIEFKKNEILANQLKVFWLYFSILATSCFIGFSIIRFFHAKQQYNESLKLQAEQIHHDIANPVQALDWSIDSMNLRKKYDEKTIVNMKQQIGLIKGTINDLYYLHDNSIDDLSKLITKPDLIYPILESVISSANHIRPEVIIVILDKVENPFLVSSISTTELRRALLNLITNAIQSVKHKPSKVEVSMFAKDGNVIINHQR